MKNPSVSVIIAARNQERYIGRCLRSLLNQNFPREDFEIIVINDASEDKTEYALSLFEREIKVIKNEARLGLPGSLNKGIRSAHGHYIIRVDADDYVNANYLFFMERFLSENQYMDAVACDYLLVDDKENILRRVNCLEEPIGCGIMFRIENLIDIGLYDDAFFFNEDKDLMVRFQKEYKIHRVELPLYRYRRHENNMTNDKEEMEKYQQNLEQKYKDTKN